jgi:hypothetical protein
MMKLALLLLTLLSIAPAQAAKTQAEFGVDRTVSPWQFCAYDQNMVCQPVFSLTPTSGGPIWLGTVGLSNLTGLGTGTATALAGPAGSGTGFATYAQFASTVASLGPLATLTPGTGWTSAIGAALGTGVGTAFGQTAGGTNASSILLYSNIGTSGNTIPLLSGANTWSGVQTYNALVNLNAGQNSYFNDPTVQGFPIAFGLWNTACASTAASCYYRGAVENFQVDGSALYPTGGKLVNCLVKGSFNQQAFNGASTTPTYVCLDVEGSLDSTFTGQGGDYWMNLGVLNVTSTSVTGGQATSGIVRGWWSGVQGFTPIRSQSENYAGRVQWGEIIDSSQSGSGATCPAIFSNGSAIISCTNTFIAHQTVQFTTTGTLPTNFALNTSYYVLTTGLSGTQFEVSATDGGAAIVAGSAGSGTNVASAALFDNSPYIGSFVHTANLAGYKVGGLTGAIAAVLPTYPFLFNNANDTATLWSIKNNGGVGVTETLSSSTTPVTLWQSTGAGANATLWAILGNDTGGNWRLRAYNDTQSAANDAIVVSRSGYVPSAVYPGTDSSETLGTGSFRWSQVWGVQVVTNQLEMAGSAPTGTTGTCSVGTFTGGTLAGSFVTPLCALATTIILSGLPTANNGYSCFATDRTTQTSLILQSATSATSATFKVSGVATVNSDVVQFTCTAY